MRVRCHGASPREMLSVCLCFCIFLASSAPLLARPQARDHTIQLKSRTFVPPEEGAVRLPEFLKSAPDDRVRLLVQFHEHPSAAARGILEEQGVRLLHYVPDRAWLVSLPRDLPPRALRGNGVRWLGPWLPDDKLSPHLRSEEPPGWAIHPDGRWVLLVQLFGDVTPEAGRAMIERHGGETLDEVPQLNALIAAGPPGVERGLAGESEVLWLEFVPPPLGPVGRSPAFCSASLTRRTRPGLTPRTTPKVFKMSGTVTTVTPDKKVS